MHTHSQTHILKYTHAHKHTHTYSYILCLLTCLSSSFLSNSLHNINLYIHIYIFHCMLPETNNHAQALSVPLLHLFNLYILSPISPPSSTFFFFYTSGRGFQRFLHNSYSPISLCPLPFLCLDHYLPFCPLQRGR